MRPTDDMMTQARRYGSTGLLALAILAAGVVAAQAATLTVRNTENAGDGSLRQALGDADKGDLILFGSDVHGEITLENTLDIDENVSIKGPGADTVTIRGPADGPALDVTADATVTGLRILGGAPAIALGHHKLTLIECAVDDSGGAGIAVDDGGHVTLVRSLVTGSHGAGVDAGGTEAVCVNSTVSGNDGAGIAGKSGRITAASCTFAANRGIAIDAAQGEASVENTLFAGNLKSCAGTVHSQGYNLTDDTSCAFAEAGDQTGIDPHLGQLADNGGHTETLAPAKGSAAIDAGNPSGCADPSASAMLASDQRGLRRPSGGRCDVGAVETQAASVASSGTVVNRIVALVDGDPITAYEVKDFAASDVRMHQAGAASPAEVLDVLITKRVIEKEVEAQGIVIQDADIDHYLANVKERNHIDDAQLDAALAQQGITRDEYRSQIREELERAQLINREIRGKVSVSPEEVARYYQEHEGAAASEDQVSISHIVLQIPHGATDQQIAAIQARADKIYAELKDGADFAEVAKRESEDGAAKSGGKLGTFKQGEMREDLEAAIADLKPGEFSKPVREANAIHIVRLDERIRAGETAMPEGKAEEIKEHLYADALEERYNRWLKEDLRQRHHVEIRP
jgi:peptidyl-prolyl cis-trans isomerase SurA